MPPPTPRTAEPSGVTATVRIATFRSRSPPGPAMPIAPQYRPRECCSQPASSDRARSLGVPVTDAGGNVASSRSVVVTSSPTVAATVDTRCHTPGAGWIRSSAGTVTLPTSATRPRSLRTRSTIITFSAMSFSEEASVAGSAPAGTVPLIGAEVTTPPVRRRNVSGEKLATQPQSPCRKADLAGVVVAASSR